MSAGVPSVARIVVVFAVAHEEEDLLYCFRVYSQDCWFCFLIVDDDADDADDDNDNDYENNDDADFNDE